MDVYGVGVYGVDVNVVGLHSVGVHSVGMHGVGCTAQAFMAYASRRTVICQTSDIFLTFLVFSLRNKILTTYFCWSNNMVEDG
jgi:hypothetical protein